MSAVMNKSQKGHALEHGRRERRPTLFARIWRGDLAATMSASLGKEGFSPVVKVSFPLVNDQQVFVLLQLTLSEGVVQKALSDSAAPACLDHVVVHDLIVDALRVWPVRSTMSLILDGNGVTKLSTHLFQDLLKHLDEFFLVHCVEARADVDLYEVVRRSVDGNERQA